MKKSYIIILLLSVFCLWNFNVKAEELETIIDNNSTIVEANDNDKDKKVEVVEEISQNNNEEDNNEISNILINNETNENNNQSIVNNEQQNNENNNEISFNVDHYIIDDSLAKIIANISIRWENQKPGLPVFEPATTNWVSALDMDIDYPVDMEEYVYKIVYKDGTTTGWLDYKGTFTIS